MKIQVINKSNNELPKYQTAGSSGMDLRACLKSSVHLAPGQREGIPTGIFLDIPEGYEGQIRPRSGLALLHGLTVLNAPGTIDSDYKLEIAVIVANLGEEVLTINDGDRIAQISFNKVEKVQLEEVEEIMFAETSERTGGFGSTGIQ